MRMKPEIVCECMVVSYKAWIVFTLSSPPPTKDINNHTHTNIHQNPLLSPCDILPDSNQQIIIHSSFF